MQHTKLTYTLFLLLFLFSTSVVLSQKKYLDSDTKVITKTFDRDTVYSNVSLLENISKITSFSHINTIFEVVDLDNLIKKEQMVTVFLTKNAGFSHMDEEELEAFLSQENRSNLKQIVSYHIIPGRVDAHAIKKAVEKGNGTAGFKTLDGKTLKFIAEGKTIYLIDSEGSKSELTHTDFYHEKGFFHVISKILKP